MAHAHEAPRDLTRNQGLVLNALATAHAPLSAYDILDRLRDDGLRAPLQVYRALEKLVERGLAHRLESLNAFVACADAHCHGAGSVAFAICQDCGKVEEFNDPAMAGRLAEISAQKGFRPVLTMVEIRGQCAQCIGQA